MEATETILTAKDTTDAGAGATGSTEQGKTGTKGAGDAGTTTQDPKAAVVAEGGKTSQAGEGEDKGADDAGKKDTGADEELAIKLPDGVTADAVLLQEFKPLAKELGLKSEGAQKLVDLSIKLQDTWAQRISEHQKTQVQEWLKQSKADKEIGGEGFAANSIIARKAVEKFGGPALKEFLVSTGLGNHPEMVRLLYRAGKGLSEDKVAGSGASGGADEEQSEEALLKKQYPNSPDMFQER